MKEPLRIYADTSVFGGPFDPEFAETSILFFDQVRLGKFELVTSGVVQAEIEPAPPDVRRLFEEMAAFARVVETTAEALALRDAYLDAGILTRRSADDALYVALATVSRCPTIVSWNFQHIVHFSKIPLYNAVNSLRGLPALAIHSPREVIEYEEKDI